MRCGVYNINFKNDIETAMTFCPQGFCGGLVEYLGACNAEKVRDEWFNPTTKGREEYKDYLLYRLETYPERFHLVQDELGVWPRNFGKKAEVVPEPPVPVECSMRCMMIGVSSRADCKSKAEMIEKHGMSEECKPCCQGQDSK